MLISDILQRKGDRVVHVPKETPVREAVKVMVENKVGAVLVIDGSMEPLGIFTERDYMRVAASSRFDTEKEVVENHMTSDDLVICLPDDKIEEAMKVMTEKRVRHLPVLRDGKLAGLVSIGDVVKATVEKQEAEIHYLKNYITQGY